MVLPSAESDLLIKVASFIASPDTPDDPEASEPNRTLLFYNDQRNFGTLTVCIEHALLESKLASLGPPWLNDGLPLADFLEIAHAQCSVARRAKVPLAKL